MKLTPVIIMSILSVVNLYSVPLPGDLKRGDMIVVKVNNHFDECYVQYVSHDFKKVGVWSEGSIPSEINFSSFNRIVVKVVKKG